MIIEALINTCIKVGYRAAINSLEKTILQAVLARTHGNKSEAARILGMARTTLVMRAKVLGVVTELH